MKANYSFVVVLALLGAPSISLAQAPAAAPVAPERAEMPAPAVAPPQAAGAPSANGDGSQGAASAASVPASSPGAVQVGAVPGVQESVGAQQGPPARGGRGIGPTSGVRQAQPAAPKPRRVKTHYPFSVQFDLMPLWQTSNGFDLFSSRDVSSRLGLSASYDLVEVAQKTPLAVEVGWSTESAEERPLFSGFETDFSGNNLHAGLKVRHQLWSFLAPYASLAGGASRLETRFTVVNAATSRDFETKKWVPFGMLGVGVAAALPLENVLIPGISVEGGYLLSGSMPLRLDSKGGGEQSLAVSGATLGTLERSGPYLRFGLFCRF